jgi:xylulokinase/glycerol kinase
MADGAGRVEQNPVVWWRGVAAALRSAGIAGIARRVAGYSVSSLRAAVLAVDSKGRPLSAAILAPDARAGAEANFLAQRCGEQFLYDATGLRPGTYSSLARILWLKKTNPKVFAKTTRIVGAQEYLVRRLCGTTVMDRSHASRSLCLNVRSKSWDQEILEAAGLPADLFPPLVDSGVIVGELTPAASRALGIPPAPVVAAGGDQMCASVGLGAVRDGQVTINHGTGSFVEAPATQPNFDPLRKILLSVHVLPNRWIQECPMLSTGRLVEDMVRSLGPARADFRAIVDASLEPTASGDCSEPLIVLPYHAGSTAPHWEPGLRGALWGLQSHHRITDLVRSLLCSILFDLRRCIELLPIKPREIVVGGGLAHLENFNQMQADIYGVPVARTSEPEATALGSAILGYTALGYYPSPDAAAREMVHPLETSRRVPRKQARADFAEMFEAQGRVLALALARAKG